MARGIVPLAHLAVVVFQVRAVGVGAEIAPLANHRVAQKSVVRLIAITYDYHVVKFATNLRVRPDGCGSVNFRAHFHHRARAERKWPTDGAALHNLAAFANVDGAVVGVQNGALNHRTVLNKDVARANNAVRCAQRLRFPPFGDDAEVVLDGLAVHLEDVGQTLNTVRVRYLLRKVFERYFLRVETFGLRLVQADGAHGVVADERLPRLQLLNFGQQFGRRNHRPVDENIVGAHLFREFCLKMRPRAVRQRPVSQVFLPLLADCQNAHTDFGCRPSEGQWKQVVPSAVVKKYVVHNRQFLLTAN